MKNIIRINLIWLGLSNFQITSFYGFNKNKWISSLLVIENTSFNINFFSTNFHKKKRFFLWNKWAKPNSFFKKINLYERRVLKIKSQPLFYNEKIIGLNKYFYSTAKVLLPINYKLLEDWFTTYFTKSLLYNQSTPKTFIKNFLLALAELKMNAVIDYYDYFGLYAIARNYFSIHSELKINKTTIRFLKPSFLKRGVNNLFKQLVLDPEFFKRKEIFSFLLKNFKRKKFLSLKKLEQWMFNLLYLPFFGATFEKTDPLYRRFFLDKYLIYWKLLPNSTRDSFGHISWLTKAEKYLYKYPHHIANVFFWKLIHIFQQKKKNFLNFGKYAFKKNLQKLLLSFSTMTIQKLIVNYFTKRTDVVFTFPNYYFNSFLSKIFNNKSDWITKNIPSTKPSNLWFLSVFKTPLINTRLSYSLIWSSAKWFFRKVLEHKNYSKLDYLKEAKYARRVLTVASFKKFIRKDFWSYAKKFVYNNLNFNYKRVLWVLFPQQKLLEYSILKGNNIKKFVWFNWIGWKFFSLLKIFWTEFKGQDQDFLDKPLYSKDFDFNKQELDEHLTSFLNDILVNQIFFTHPYFPSYKYYKQIFYSKKKTRGHQFFFSNNQVLSDIIIRSPVLLTSWMFVDHYYMLIINKSDFANYKIVKDYVSKSSVTLPFEKPTKYNWFLDHILSFQNIISSTTGSFLNFFSRKIFDVKNVKYSFYLIKLVLSKNTLTIPLYFLLFYFFTFLSSVSKQQKQLTLYNLTMLYWTTFFRSLFFSQKFSKYFCFTGLSQKIYLNQTLRSRKTLPITYFRYVGYNWTKFNGAITLFAHNFNVFSASVYYEFTLNWNNPYYFSQNLKDDLIFNIPNALEINNFYDYSSLNFLISDFFFENYIAYVALGHSLNQFNAFNFYTNNTILNWIKDILLKLQPSNILNKASFKYWFNYVVTFENLSSNFLTSKLWWNTHLQDYFFGSLQIYLFSTNWTQLAFISRTQPKYLRTMYALSTMEAQLLSFADFAIPFQFDPNKIIHGWKFWVYNTFYKENFTFFFKNMFSKYFSKINPMEILMFTTFISSILFSITWFTFIERFFFSYLQHIPTPVTLFPDTFFTMLFFEKFKLWWFFFGFSENFMAAGSTVNSSTTLLLISLYISRVLVFSPIYFTYFQQFITQSINNTYFLTFFSFLPKKLEFLFRSPTANTFNLKLIKSAFFNSSTSNNYLPKILLSSKKLNSFFDSNFNNINDTVGSKASFNSTWSRTTTISNFFQNVFSVNVGSYTKKIILFGKNKSQKFTNELRSYIDLSSLVNFFNYFFYKGWCISTTKSINFIISNISSRLSFFLLKKKIILTLKRKYLSIFFLKILFFLRLFFLCFINKKKIKHFLLVFFYKYLSLHKKLGYHFFLLKKLSMHDTRFSFFTYSWLLNSSFTYTLKLAHLFSIFQQPVDFLITLPTILDHTFFWIRKKFPIRFFLSFKLLKISKNLFFFDIFFFNSFLKLFSSFFYSSLTSILKNIKVLIAPYFLPISKLFNIATKYNLAKNLFTFCKYWNFFFDTTSLQFHNFLNSNFNATQDHIMTDILNKYYLLTCISSRRSSLLQKNFFFYSFIFEKPVAELINISLAKNKLVYRESKNHSLSLLSSFFLKFWLLFYYKKQSKYFFTPLKVFKKKIILSLKTNFSSIFWNTFFVKFKKYCETSKLFESNNLHNKQNFFLLPRLFSLVKKISELQKTNNFIKNFSNFPFPVKFKKFLSTQKTILNCQIIKHSLNFINKEIKHKDKILLLSDSLLMAKFFFLIKKNSSFSVMFPFLNFTGFVHLKSKFIQNQQNLQYIEFFKNFFIDVSKTRSQHINKFAYGAFLVILIVFRINLFSSMNYFSTSINSNFYISRIWAVVNWVLKEFGRSFFFDHYKYTLVKSLIQNEFQKLFKINNSNTNLDIQYKNIFFKKYETIILLKKTNVLLNFFSNCHFIPLIENSNSTFNFSWSYLPKKNYRINSIDVTRMLFETNPALDVSKSVSTSLQAQKEFIGYNFFFLKILKTNKILLLIIWFFFLFFFIEHTSFNKQTR